MALLCFGISHHSAPLHLVEPLSFAADELREFLRRIPDENVSEVFGLSTCNRTEFFLEVNDTGGGREKLLSHLAHKTGGDLSLQIEHSFTHEDDHAARHLMRVASGVDSMIVGEVQILGQIRDAVDLAREAGTAGRILSELARRAIAAGRRAHAETAIGRGRVSVASVSVTIAQKVFSDLSRKRGLLIGAGQTSKLAGANFRRAGLGSIVVANRTLSRAQALAEELEGEAVPFEDFHKELARADIVVVATGSQEYVITAAMVAEARKRNSSPLVMVDLSLPRNIDPAVAKMDFVFLSAIEDLEAVAKENKAQRQAEMSAVEEIVREELSKFSQWYARSEADQLVMLLRRQIEETRLAHLRRYGSKMPEEARAKLDKFSESLMRGVFHNLTENMRHIDLSTEQGRREYETICRLFGLHVGDSGER